MKLDRNELYYELQYFVRKTLRSGSDTYEPYQLANKWFEEQKEIKKDKDVTLYYAYHFVKELLPTWAQREGVELVFPNEKQKVHISPSELRELELQIKKQRIKLLVSLKELKEVELYYLYKRLTGDFILPEYLEKIVTVKKQKTQVLVSPIFEGIMNGANTVFIALFILVVMLLNL